MDGLSGISTHTSSLSVSDARSEEKSNDETQAAKASTETSNEPAAIVSLSPEAKQQEQAEVEKLKKRDQQVRAHEQAHQAALGSYSKGGPQYEYKNGPDGKRYAVGGEVAVDMSEAETPQQTVQKARTIRRAALAPADPSSADRAVAAQASQMEAKAQQEIAKEAKSKTDPNNQTQTPGLENSRHRITPKLNVLA